MIARTTSEDMYQWSEAKIVLEPDDDDPPGTQFYCMPVYRDRGVYYGFLWVYHPNQLTVDVQLTFSRDGSDWQRVGRRHPILSFGLPHQFDSSQVMALNPVLVGDELKVFYLGQDAPHPLVYNNEAFPPLKVALPRKEQPWLEKRTGSMGLATTLRDRFVSLDGGDKGGQLVTKPFVFTGKELHLNADASRGELRLEFLDEEGKPIPKFSGNACRLRGDGVHLKTMWNGSPDVSSLQGRTVKLRMYVDRYVKLYAFQVMP